MDRKSVPTKLIMIAETGGSFIFSDARPIPAARQSSESAADISKTFNIVQQDPFFMVLSGALFYIMKSGTAA